MNVTKHKEQSDDGREGRKGEKDLAKNEGEKYEEKGNTDGFTE